MFDLNEAIGSWRSGLRAQPGIQAADLDELEDHLRQEIADLREAKLSEEESFLIAARRLGRPEDLNTEFAIADPRGRRQFRLSWMITGALAVIFLWLAAEVLGNFAAGTLTRISPPGPLWLGGVGGLVRILILVVGGIVVWRLLSRDTWARRLGSLGIGAFVILALILFLLATGVRLGSQTFFLTAMPHDAMIATAVVMNWIRLGLMVILPLLLLVGLWRLVANR